ncbi:hypothetical protein YC2023_026004 [Brassica napus]
MMRYVKGETIDYLTDNGRSLCETSENKIEHVSCRCDRNEKSASGEKMQQRDTATIFHGCSICQTDSMIRQRICRGSDSDCTDA